MYPIIKPILVILFTIMALALFARTLYILVGLLKRAKPFRAKFSLYHSLRDLLVIVLGQKKVLSWAYSGVLHVMIFWGFIVLFTTIVEMYGEAFTPGFVFPLIGGTRWLAFLQELFTIMVMVGVGMAVFLRLIIRPKRYQGSNNVDAIMILGLIVVLMISLVFMHAERVHAGIPYTDGFFLSKRVAELFAPATLYLLAEANYWLHLVTVLFFLNWIPRGKHLHLLAIAPNILLRKRGPRGKIAGLDLEDESIEVFGANRWTEFPAKELLDTYACMECGRCVAECPANFTGKELDPKYLHTGIRYSTQKDGKHLLKAADEKFIQLVDNVFTEEFFWQCTTCAACVEQCPAANEHIDKIINVRRHLVLTEGRMRSETAQAIKSMEKQGNPFQMAAAERFNWAKDLDVPTIQDKPNAEYLYWVGCFGAYDPRNKKVTASLVKIMQQTGVSFAVLGKEEKCTGDLARRIGREDLFQELARENIATLNSYNVKKIITQCPHCYNTFKHEYPDFGGHYQVIHHTELLAQLLSEKKLTLNKPLPQRIVYHDSCYLGRHNNIYQPPRQVLAGIPGAKILEMARKGSTSFCCGGGGGRMFMEEIKGKRINVERVEEAAKANPDILAANCPYCLSMFEDGLKSIEKQEQIRTCDLAELVVEAMHK